MKNEILITIVIPMFNVENFIATALDSIKDQQDVNIEDYEVLIIDDGSTDSSFDVAKKWINDNNFANYKIFKKQNGNWGSVINYVKEKKLAKGKYTSILDADDNFEPKLFWNIINVIKMNNDYDLILTNFYRKRDNKKKKTKVIYSCNSKELKKNKTFTAWSIPLCKFFRTSLFYDVKKLNEGVSYQDQILYHSFVQKSNKFFFLKKNLGCYFENREGSSTSQKWDLKRINLWCSNMNELLSLNNRQVAAYVMMMINYCYKNSPKELKHHVKIDKKNIEIFKKSKFSWLPWCFSFLAKIIFKISTLKIIKNSNN